MTIVCKAWGGPTTCQVDNLVRNFRETLTALIIIWPDAFFFLFLAPLFKGWTGPTLHCCIYISTYIPKFSPFLLHSFLFIVHFSHHILITSCPFHNLSWYYKHTGWPGIKHDVTYYPISHNMCQAHACILRPKLLHNLKAKYKIKFHPCHCLLVLPVFLLLQKDVFTENLHINFCII